MSPFFDKQSDLDKRIRKIRKELSSIDSNLKSLSRKPPAPISGDRPAGEPGRPAAGPRGAFEAQGFQGSGDEIRAKPGVNTRDERFAEYLANSFQTVRPLRRERRLQRNKAIVISVFVLILLALILYWFLP